jgi:mycofactocin system glycosyltransferase
VQGLKGDFTTAGFGFSLADSTYLRADADGFFLLSHTPLRLLRLNEALFNLLRHIRDGGELSEYLEQNHALESVNIFRVLLSLVARGYLKLDRIAPLTDFPRVSIIIPVRDQPEDLLDCLKSLENLRYPKDRRETIVVDDGSQKDVSQIITSTNIRVIRHENSRGPADCRNIGAAKASGDILAFLDADCLAGENWLNETVPFFRATGAGAVGGYVDGYYQDSFLDRYEKVFSSLNMGKRLIIEAKTESGFYVPTANFLVAREAFSAAGGFKEGMHIGEDVDFCWRLKDLGYTLLYVPSGSVAHKHRSRLGSMLKRRAEYGTSEAVLYRAHRDKKKGFAVSLYAGLSFLALALAILMWNPYPLCALPLIFGIDLWQKYTTVNKLKMVLTLPQLVSSALRSYLSFSYFAFFHLIRYYLILMAGLGVLWYPLWVFGGVGILCTSVVDFTVKKPALLYPVFLFYYLAEHLAYQVGVFWGCLKRGSFGSYLLSFRRA